MLRRSPISRFWHRRRQRAAGPGWQHSLRPRLELRRLEPRRVLTVSAGLGLEQLLVVEGASLVLPPVSPPTAGPVASATIDWGDGTTSSGVLDPETGAARGAHTYADNGRYQGIVEFRGFEGEASYAAIDVLVTNVAPQLAVVPDQTVELGQTLSLSPLGTFTDPGFDNPDNLVGEQTETFTYAIDWGDGSPLKSDRATIDVHGLPGVPTAGSIPGEHVYSAPGTYTVSVTLSDDDGGKDTMSFQVDVTAPTLFEMGPDQRTVEGALLELPELASFTIVTPDGLSIDYLIDWGDGRPVDAGSVPSSGDPLTSGVISGSHTYADNGAYDVTVLLFAGQELLAGGQLSVVVENVAPSLSVVGDQSITLGEVLSLPSLGQFTDPGFDNSANPVGERAETFTFAVDWGDSSTIDSGPGIVTTPGAAGILTAGSFGAAHLYSAAGTYTVSVSLSDDDGGSQTRTFQVRVDAAASLIAAPDQQTLEGSLLDTSTLAEYTASVAAGQSLSLLVDWGDGTAPDVEALPPAASSGVVQGTLAGSHTYADNGTYTVAILMSRAGELLAADSLQVRVENVAPSLAVVPDRQITLGDPLVLTPLGTFRDPGFDNPLNQTGETAETFTYAIDWGDGSAVVSGSGRIEQPGAEGLATTGSFDSMHQYAAPGEFTVRVTLADDDGGSDTQSFTVTVGFIVPPQVVTTDVFVGPPIGSAADRPVVVADPGGAASRPTSSEGISQVEPRLVRGGGTVGNQMRLVLRRVAPNGEELRQDEVVLEESRLDDLRAVFSVLPDDRYRIYRIRPDGVEELVVDVLVRDGRPLPSDAAPAKPQPKTPAPGQDAPADAPRALPDQTSLRRSDRWARLDRVWERYGAERSGQAAAE